MKDLVLVKPEDKISAIHLLEFLTLAVDKLRAKILQENDETTKQMLHGAVSAYVELHSIVLEQIRFLRIKEGEEESDHYDA